MIKTRKNLGQNFLKDSRVLDRIAAVLNIVPEDIVVEIGPGHGELTRRILAYSPRGLIAVEKDPGLIVHHLQELVATHRGLRVIQGDALTEIPRLADGELSTTSYKLVGNIPYYITGRLLRVVGELEHKPATIVLTIQKEVAEKLCAQPPKMNLLADSVQAWGEPEIIRYVSRKSFNPSPRVDSATIRIAPREKEPGANFYPFIHALFSQPRKTTLNNLKTLGLPRETIEEGLARAGVGPKVRPQDLDMEQIEKLSILFTRAQS